MKEKKSIKNMLAGLKTKFTKQNVEEDSQDMLLTVERTMIAVSMAAAVEIIG